MATPVKLYQQEMHRNLGYFATWLPTSILELGDIGVWEGGRFRKVASLTELGLGTGAIREGNSENMSYSASAKRSMGVSAGASSTVPLGSAELSIQFSSQGGFVFDATGVRNIEIAERIQLGEKMLQAYRQGHWQKEWMLVEAMYRADSATIIVSEDSSSEIVLKAEANVPLGTLPLSDPKVGLNVSSTSGKIVHVVAAGGLSPLYSCLKVDKPIFSDAKVVPVLGLSGAKGSEVLSRPSIADLLDS